MSDLGLGNLTDLKRFLFAQAMVTETIYDLPLAAIGKGVAKAMERHCNREWARVAGATVEFPANRESFVLPRYPIESISAVAVRDTIADGFVAQTVNDIILNRNDAAGLLEFGSVLSSHTSIVKVTYTGGYWYDTDENYGTAQPAGSTGVPDDLKHAWLKQCHHEFFTKQKTMIGGKDVVDSLGASVTLDSTFLPTVVETLKGFIRFT